MDPGLSVLAEQALAGAKAAPTLRPQADQAKMRKVAEDFEAFFLGQMMQPMFARTEAAAPFGGGPSERLWRSLQVDEYGKAFARAGGIGIADMVLKEMLRLQEKK